MMQKINKIISLVAFVLLAAGAFSLTARCKNPSVPSPKKLACVNENTSCSALYQRVGEVLGKQSKILPVVYTDVKKMICCKGPQAQQAWMKLYHLVSTKTILQRNVKAQVARYLERTYGVVMTSKKEAAEKPLSLPKETRGGADACGDSTCARDFAAVSVAISHYLVSFEQVKHAIEVYTALFGTMTSTARERRSIGIELKNAWITYQAAIEKLNALFKLMNIDNHFVVDESMRIQVESILIFEGLE